VKVKSKQLRILQERNIILDDIKLQPHGPRVMVEYDDDVYETINGTHPAKKAASGLFIPKIATERKQGEAYDATVLKVGNGRFKLKLMQRIPCTLKPGDRIKIPAFNFPIEGNGTNGIPIGRTVYIVDENAVLGRV